MRLEPSPLILASDSLERPALPQSTRIIFPKNKPLEWSTSIAPGEYGDEDPDPLASRDFMTDFMPRMCQLVGDEPAIFSSGIGSISYKAKLLLRLHYPSEGYQLHVYDSTFFLGWQNKPHFSVS